MSDLINRDLAILELAFSEKTKSLKCGQLAKVIEILLDLPSVEPESLTDSEQLKDNESEV